MHAAYAGTSTAAQPGLHDAGTPPPHDSVFSSQHSALMSLLILTKSATVAQWSEPWAGGVPAKSTTARTARAPVAALAGSIGSVRKGAGMNVLAARALAGWRARPQQQTQPAAAPRRFCLFADAPQFVYHHF